MTPNPLPPAKIFARERANHHPRSLCERWAVARARRTTQRGLAQPPRPATPHSNGGLELPVSVHSSTALRARPRFQLPARARGKWGWGEGCGWGLSEFSLLFSKQLALGGRVRLRSGVFMAFTEEKRGFADSRPLWFAYWKPRSVDPRSQRANTPPPLQQVRHTHQRPGNTRTGPTRTKKPPSRPARCPLGRRRRGPPSPARARRPAVPHGRNQNTGPGRHHDIGD